VRFTRSQRVVWLIWIGLKYRRKPVIVFTEDNGSVEAVTYIMLEQSEETKPTLEYLAVIKQGYRDWGIV